MAFVAQMNGEQWIRITNTDNGYAVNAGHFSGGVESFSVCGDQLVVKLPNNPYTYLYDCRTGNLIRKL